MSEDRKPHSIWPWIAALLIGLPVLYVAAAPALTYVECDCPDPYRTWASEANNIYHPLWFVMDHCPALSHIWYLYMDHWP